MVESGTTSNNLSKEINEKKKIEKKKYIDKDGRQVGLGPHQDGADQHTTQRAKKTKKFLSNFLVHKLVTQTSEAIKFP